MPEERIRQAQALLQAEGLSALVVTHAPNIRYLTGLNASAGLLLVDTSTARLVVDFRYASAASGLPGAGSAFDVHVADGSLDVAAADLLSRFDGGRIGVEGDHLPVGRFTRLASRLASGPQMPTYDEPGSRSLIPTERVVERLRAVKDAAELETMREAGARLSSVARRLRDWAVEGRQEREVAADIDHAMRLAGFERPAFETIVASGPNAALPHARPTGRRLDRGDGVVLDFGGVYDGYCVDLTRTVAIGPVNGSLRHLFEAVQEAQAAAVQAVRPGVTTTAIDAAARTVLERHGLGEAFGHGTGHGLGLEIHEDPRISKHGPGEPVKAGMVFTIEPGAYVAGLGGVRIEDDVRVTADGCELLTDVPIDF